MGPHLDDIMTPFFKAFNECNRHDRQLFFSDPLVNYLWGVFRYKCSGQILTHFARLKRQYTRGSEPPM